jgi:hypothetical protein
MLESCCLEQPVSVFEFCHAIQTLQRCTGFSESPVLQERDLPPMAKRQPDDPVVIVPSRKSAVMAAPSGTVTGFVV